MSPEFCNENIGSNDQARQEVIDAHDKNLLESGLMALGNHLNALGVDKLPDVLIFPEISSRPLVYAVMPLIKTIYEKKNKRLPHFAFFNTRGNDREFSTDILYRHIYGENYLTEIKKETTAKDEFDAYLSQSRMNDAIRAFENTREPKKAMACRAEEIIKKSGITDCANILVVDDYINNGTTYYQIKEAVETFDTKINTEAFAFISNEDYSVKRPGVTVGSVDESGRATPGFHYRTSDNRTKAIGVEQNKDAAYTKISNDRDAGMMQEIRSSMKSIGTKVAEFF